MLAAIGPAVVLSGAALPLLFHHLRRESSDLGLVAGRLYSWNTVGSLCGALLGGYALLFWLDLDQVFTLAVAQTCQQLPDACLTLLASWAHDDPNSPERRRIEAAIRRHPVYSRRTPLELVAPLSRLYGAPVAEIGTDALGAAHRATEQFVTYYHHAAPFSRRALSDLWRRCQAEPALRSRCLADRAIAERMLGDLETGLRAESSEGVSRPYALRSDRLSP
jgi:hypothetical protein